MVQPHDGNMTSADQSLCWIGRLCFICLTDFQRSHSFDQGGEADDALLSPVDSRNPAASTVGVGGDLAGVQISTTPDTVKSATNQVSQFTGALVTVGCLCPSECCPFYIRKASSVESVTL